MSRGLRTRRAGAAALALAVLACAGGARAQLGRYTLGDGGRSWAEGGGRGDPVHLVKSGVRAVLDTGNAPGADIEFEHRPGWISPRYYDGETNIAGLVLERGGRIRAPNSIGRPSALVRRQLQGLVNGDHTVAFERKPTLLEPTLTSFGIWVWLDFGRQVGVERIRFYPRNTVAATPETPFHDDYLRAYEVWINPRQTDRAAGSPDILVERATNNTDPVVDVHVNPRYVRQVKLRSLSERPFEVDELEVYGTGYLNGGVYYSDLIDLGGRASIGPLRWVEEIAGPPEFSEMRVRVRTGNDDTPLVFRRRVPDPEDPESTILAEITPEEYWDLESHDRAGVVEDIDSWSPWKSAAPGALVTAPIPRRWVQFRLEFAGRLFDTRQVDSISFPYLRPPIADTLRAEVYPRLAQVEEPASFRYAVRVGRAGAVLGFDQLEVDTTVPMERVREVRLNGEPLEVEVLFSRHDAFRIGLPLISGAGDVLEFTFDLPVFRFGTTFSGRAINSRYPSVPQPLEAGDAADFGPGDHDELSGLFVAIPEEQIGRLVGQIALSTPVVTPNGDGLNDGLRVQFNLLQLTDRAPVRFELFDLSGRRVADADLGLHGLGPSEYLWDGRGADGRVLAPGTYIWRLRIDADAFAEDHHGVLAVAY